MNMIKKFGGNCIDSIEKLEQIADQLCEGAFEELPLVVVRPLKVGEAGAADILADALRRRGVTCDRINSCGNYGEFPFYQIEQALEVRHAVIVESMDHGSGGQDPGRLGAETLSVAIAAHLGWDCEFYTDVDCIHTVDPELYPAAKRLDLISYDEMMELSALGTGALEAGSVELARQYDVRIYLGNAQEKDHSRGTYIMDDSTYVKDMAVTGITTAEDYTIFTVKGIEDDLAMIAELFDLLGELEINVDMISKQTQRDGKSSISFSCIGSAAPNLEEALASHKTFASAEVFRQENVVMISLVGAGMATRSGVAGKVFSLLRRAEIPCFQITTSEISISIAIPKEKKQLAVDTFCQGFDL